MDAMVSGVGVEAVEYHQDSGTFRIQFDQEQTPASTAVIATLAEVMDADPVELDPLYCTVDPDMLDALICVRKGNNGDIQVSFTHEDHAITVYSYGVVTITPGHEATAKKIERTAGR